MATLLRFSRHSRIIFNNLARSRTKCLPCCQISTSDKKKDVLTHVEPPMTQPQHKSEELKELEEHFADADPNKLKVHSLNTLSDCQLLCGFSNTIYQPCPVTGAA